MTEQRNNLYFNKIFNSKTELYDTLLYQYNLFIYNHGNHLIADKKSLKRNYRSKIYRLFSFYHFLIKKKGGEQFYISNSYADLDLPFLTSYLPPWHISFKKDVYLNWKLSNVVFKILSILEKKRVKSLTSSNFRNLLKDYKEEFTKMILKDKLLFLMVPNDMSLFENITVKICKENKIPTFVYLHGLPARYNIIDDNRADFLIVWGKGLKDLYVKAGFNPSKILTIKHPIYSNYKFSSLRSDLKNVLVLTKAMPGSPSSSLDMVLPDRANSLYYVESVKQILLKLGVKSAKLRLHPSENPSFYKDHLIDDFYVIDSLDKSSTLNNSTLVVGPSSTMLLDAINHNVNYILYDPIINNKALDFELQLVPPFDGSSFINLSSSLEDIKKNILNPVSNINFDLLNQFFEIDKNDYEKLLTIINNTYNNSL